MNRFGACSDPRTARVGGRARRLRRLGVLGLVLLAVGLLSVRYRLVWVVGDSMRPTFRAGEVLLVDRWAYRRRPPARGDVILASHHGDLMIKRVVGLPGEDVGVRDGRVQINGVPLEEPQVVEIGPLEIEAGRLSGDRFAVLGDNRAVPQGDFVHAVVRRDQVFGRVLFRQRSPS